ncbi:AAA family ATPase [Kitasatospora sp. NPDC101155]|uniref:AAA family ATPase n=1 Tax=Kitasatospora sp. NPDC101155 TaxID=3364097 RepID=UPI00381FDFD9
MEREGPAIEYSRGMKQKLGLVQALQHDPELVVLDEPTEGLDPLVQEVFFTLLEEATQTAAVIAASLALNAVATLVIAGGAALSPALHHAVTLRGVLAAGLTGCAFTLCLSGPALAVSAATRDRAQVIGATIALGAVHRPGSRRVRRDRRRTPGPAAPGPGSLSTEPPSACPGTDPDGDARNPPGIEGRALGTVVPPPVTNGPMLG